VDYEANVGEFRRPFSRHMGDRGEGFFVRPPDPVECRFIASGGVPAFYDQLSHFRARFSSSACRLGKPFMGLHGEGASPLVLAEEKAVERGSMKT